MSPGAPFRTLPAPYVGTNGLIGPKPMFAPAWPIYTVLYGFSVFWVLGLASFAWLVAAIPMLFWLMASKGTRLPGGTGIWVLFLGWVALSMPMVDTATSLAVWGHRFLLYVGAGIAFVYAYNIPRSGVSDRSIARAITALWALMVLAGFAAIAFPQFEFRNPFQSLLPGGLAQNEYVVGLVQTRLAQIHDFLGFEVARPAAPFVYTNNWGSNFALLSPMVFVFTASLQGWRRVLLIAVGIAAIVPVVQSLNRGMWISLGIGLLYTAGRIALSRGSRPPIAIVSAMALLVLVIVLTPLGSLIGDRLETGHSDERRLSLYEQSIGAALEAPFFGHGGTVEDATDPSGPPVGTHGQIWVLLVSHGFPASLAFLGFFVYLLVRTGRSTTSPFVFGVNVTLVVAFVQMGIYFLIPSQLPLLMVVSALALRHLDAGRSDGRRATRGE